MFGQIFNAHDVLLNVRFNVRFLPTFEVFPKEPPRKKAHFFLIVEKTVDIRLRDIEAPFRRPKDKTLVFAQQSTRLLQGVCIALR